MSPAGSFIDTDDARPLRILTEYLEPLTRFRAQRMHDAVVFLPLVAQSALTGRSPAIAPTRGSWPGG